MSKGKQYFDALLVEGMERLMAKGCNSTLEKTSCRTQIQTPRSPGPIKLRCYLSQKSKQKRQDGKCSILNFPLEQSAAPQTQPQQVEPKPAPSPYEHKISELKSFVKAHIDSEDNYQVFESMLKTLETLQKQQLRGEQQCRGKSFTLENGMGSSENFHSPQHKLSFDLLSPMRLKRLTSATMSPSDNEFETSKKVSSSIFKPVNDRI